MRITRSGSERYHGSSHIDLWSTHLEWDKKNACASVKAYNIKDFNTEAHHDYSVSISLEEVSELVQLAASAVEGGAVSNVCAIMGPALPSLLKLALACTEPSHELTDIDV